MYQDKIKVSGLNEELIEKIELLIKGHCPNKMIAQALNISVDKVIEYKAVKAEIKSLQAKQLKDEKRRAKYNELKEIREKEVALDSTYTKATKHRKRKHKVDIDPTEDSDNVTRMRYLRTLGHSPYKIALTFGTSYNRVWPHIRDIAVKETIRQPRIIVSKEDIKEIIHLNSKGFTDDQIGRFLGLTETTITNQLRRLGKKSN